jgi:hypothetical protein
LSRLTSFNTNKLTESKPNARITDRASNKKPP